jgi:hypothetical protein
MSNEKNILLKNNSKELQTEIKNKFYLSDLENNTGLIETNHQKKLESWLQMALKGHFPYLKIEWVKDLSNKDYFLSKLNYKEEKFNTFLNKILSLQNNKEVIYYLERLNTSERKKFIWHLLRLVDQVNANLASRLQ